MNTGGRQTPDNLTMGLEMTPPRAKHRYNVATHTFNHSAKWDDCLLVGFGVRKKIQSIIEGTREYAKAACVCGFYCPGVASSSM